MLLSWRVPALLYGVPAAVRLARLLAVASLFFRSGTARCRRAANSAADKRTQARAAPPMDSDGRSAGATGHSDGGPAATCARSEGYGGADPPLAEAWFGAFWSSKQATREIASGASPD